MSLLWRGDSGTSPSSAKTCGLLWDGVWQTVVWVLPAGRGDWWGGRRLAWFFKQEGRERGPAGVFRQLLLGYAPAHPIHATCLHLALSTGLCSRLPPALSPPQREKLPVEEREPGSLPTLGKKLPFQWRYKL